jgi:hypothetical protein
MHDLRCFQEECLTPLDLVIDFAAPFAEALAFDFQSIPKNVPASVPK